MKFINNNSVLIIHKHVLHYLGEKTSLLLAISKAIEEKRAVIKGDELFLATKDQAELNSFIQGGLGTSYSQGIIREDEKEAVLNELKAYIQDKLENMAHELLLRAVFGENVQMRVIKSRFA